MSNLFISLLRACFGTGEKGWKRTDGTLPFLHLGLFNGMEWNVNSSQPYLYSVSQTFCIPSRSGGTLHSRWGKMTFLSRYGMNRNKIWRGVIVMYLFPFHSFFSKLSNILKIRKTTTLLYIPFHFLIIYPFHSITFLYELPNIV